MSIFSNPFINWRRLIIYSILAVFSVSLALFLRGQEKRAQQKRVILCVIDGLRADAIKILGKDLTPNIHYLIQNGASTLNARTDYHRTTTLPNTVSILTGRPVYGATGHNYTMNLYMGRAIHDVKNNYVESVFDAFYREGLRSSFFASKSKLGLFVKSYVIEQELNEQLMKKKNLSRFQSYYVTDWEDEETFENFVRELVHFDSSFLFLHLSGPDAVGHQYGWDVDVNSPYMKKIAAMDGYIGIILKTIRKQHHLKNSTYLIVTSDHGGDGESHFDIANQFNYTVPFIVWGPGVAKGKDLYDLNRQYRQDPKHYQVPYETSVAPIRNSEAGNLALSLLELPAIKDSVINALQNLNVFP